MQRRLTPLLLALVLVVGCKSRSNGPPPPSERPALSLSTLLKDPKVAIVDVRTPGEFQGGHIPKAINVPLSQVATIAKQLGDDKSRPVVVYCLSGARSGQAQRLLSEMGYQKVLNGGGVRQLASKMGVTLQK